MPVATLVNKMRFLASDEYWNDSSADEEDRHIKADAILCEALLASVNGGLNIDDAKEIVAIFTSLKKWYS